MVNLQVLDCTLRDGGYVNNWEFGFANIRKMLRYLTDSRIDIIECGFLSNKQGYQPDQSIFDTVDRFKDVIPTQKHQSKYVCMINYGEYELEDIPDYDGTSVDGIRVVFHQRELEEALEFCRALAHKGYMLFIQPMVTINYTDQELLKIVDIVNEISPYAFYIVDSFGVMKKNDLMRMFYLIDNNLNSGIRIGYHSHNNLQLAYSNAQALVEVQASRERIIDSSVFGMGRGAGNLNTELFVQHLNEHFDTSYNVYPLLKIIDEVLNKIYATNYWGYSLPHYLSAVYNCHPNYASYLADKNTLDVKAIEDILSSIPNEKRSSFSKSYTEEIYTNYQKRLIDDSKAKFALQKEVLNRNVLIIAPGNSALTHEESINEFIKNHNPICISVNFVPDQFKCDFTFVSNAKRYDNVMGNEKGKHQRLIVTSNIQLQSERHLYINYSNLLNLTDAVADNATLMLLKLLIDLGVTNVFIAGFDGYSHDHTKNYVNKELIFNTSPKQIRELNTGIAKVLNELMENLHIEFLTPTKYSGFLTPTKYSESVLVK